MDCKGSHSSDRLHGRSRTAEYPWPWIRLTESLVCRSGLHSRAGSQGISTHADGPLPGTTLKTGWRFEGPVLSKCGELKLPQWRDERVVGHAG